MPQHKNFKDKQNPIRPAALLGPGARIPGPLAPPPPLRAPASPCHHAPPPLQRPPPSTPQPGRAARPLCSVPARASLAHQRRTPALPRRRAPTTARPHPCIARPRAPPAQPRRPVTTAPRRAPPPSARPADAVLACCHCWRCGRPPLHAPAPRAPMLPWSCHRLGRSWRKQQ
ncbi:arabinogalactan protein 1-like [Miscanthus floridulus]|uniref:arabinogalactan protein 1-like n=1 Tax=Miscanthus floridulus TaxID=154761 RepID=UPI00345ACD10